MRFFLLAFFAIGISSVTFAYSDNTSYSGYMNYSHFKTDSYMEPVRYDDDTLGGDCPDCPDQDAIDRFENRLYKAPFRQRQSEEQERLKKFPRIFPLTCSTIKREEFGRSGLVGREEQK